MVDTDGNLIALNPRMRIKFKLIEKEVAATPDLLHPTIHDSCFMLHASCMLISMIALNGTKPQHSHHAFILRVCILWCRCMHKRAC